MKLYDFLPSGNGYKVRLTLRALGVPFELVEVDILKGESRTPEFLARNPFGQIPTLILDDGTALRESHAIALYLAEGSSLLPSDKLLRTRVIEWMCFEQTHVDGVISRARFRKKYPDVVPTQAHEFVAWHAQGEAALSTLENHLATRDYLIGDRFSVADIALYAYVHCADEGGFELASRAALQRWFERVRAQRGHCRIDELPT